MTITRTQPEPEVEPPPPPRRRRRQREKYNRRETIAGLLFISPWIIGFTVFTVISMAWSLRLSFSNYDLATNEGTPVGFANYQLLLEDPKVLTSLGNTFFYTLLAVPLEMIIALALASLLATVRRGAGVFRTIFFLPKMTPVVATAVGLPAAAQRQHRRDQPVPRAVRHPGSAVADRSRLGQAGHRDHEPVDGRRLDGDLARGAAERAA